MHKIGMSLQTQYALPMEDTLQLLKDIGFRAVSPMWQPTSQLEPIVNAAVRSGLTLQSLHGNYQGILGMWTDDSAQRDPIFQKLRQGIDDCANYGIPVLVIHPWKGFYYKFSADSLYFRNFDLLIEHAKNNHVQIAFENLEGPEFLDALMQRYAQEDAVGFCWDSGHAFCYAPELDFLERYGDRLIMTHLNDNYGITRPDGTLQGADDLHLLPFDGKCPWDAFIAALKSARPQEFLNFELKVRPKEAREEDLLYTHQPLPEYFTDAYLRCCRLADAYFA